jgi:hypothetical protein
MPFLPDYLTPPSSPDSLRIKLKDTKFKLDSEKNCAALVSAVLSIACLPEESSGKEITTIPTLYLDFVPSNEDNLSVEDLPEITLSEMMEQISGYAQELLSVGDSAGAAFLRLVLDALTQTDITALMEASYAPQSDSLLDQLNRRDDFIDPTTVQPLPTLIKALSRETGTPPESLEAFIQELELKNREKFGYIPPEILEQLPPHLRAEYYMNKIIAVGKVTKETIDRLLADNSEETDYPEEE